MIKKEISLTPNDYNTLKGFVGKLEQRISDKKLLNEMMGEFASMTIWDRADLSISEELYGNLLTKEDFAWCIKDNQIHSFEILNRPAVKGDIVYITDKSSILPDGYVGKYYRVSDRYKGNARILGIDTYRDGQKIYISLHDDQYIVLNEI